MSTQYYLIVFGSGGARRIPDGFDRTRAWAQLVDFGRRIGPLAEERGVTIAMQDSSGPYDYHLTRKLIKLCQEHDIDHQRDVFPFYHSDSASALQAGNDIRTALIGFGADSSHGYERTHLNALQSVAELVTIYAQSRSVIDRDKSELGPLEGFPHQIDPQDMRGPDPQLPHPVDFLDAE